MGNVPFREEDPPSKTVAEIEPLAPDHRDRTPRERIGDALLLTGIIAVSCGLWLFLPFWLYSVRHVLLRLF